MALFLLCIKIFCARIMDVSLGTIRTILTIKGKKGLASLTGFCEVIIWFLIVREALNTDMTSFLIPISYAGGFASGTFLGGLLSDTFISGNLGVQIGTSHKDRGLIETIRNQGYGVSVIEVNNHEPDVSKYMLFVEIDKKKLNHLKCLVKQIDEKAFIVVSETKYVQNGYFK